MTPKEFPGSNVVYAKDQPEYLPLPAMKDEEGNVTTCWELTDEEIKAIVQHRCLYIHMLTFNAPLQPIRPYVDEYVEPVKVYFQPISPDNIDELMECREAFNETKMLLGEEDKDHLIEMIQTLVAKEGAEAAWPCFKFEDKVDPKYIETFKKAFRYMEFSKESQAPTNSEVGE